MTQDEIIEMTRQAGGFDATPKFLETFAKLVEKRTKSRVFKRAEIAAELAIEHAIELERKEIAQFIKNDYVRQFEKPWREDLSAAILARSKE
jgi:DNA-binding transcriptional regulator GbsR (MarR family)